MMFNGKVLYKHGRCSNIENSKKMQQGVRKNDGGVSKLRRPPTLKHGSQEESPLGSLIGKVNKDKQFSLH